MGNSIADFSTQGLGEIKSRFVTTLMQARLEVKGQLLQPELDLGRYSDNSYIFYSVSKSIRTQEWGCYELVLGVLRS